MRKIIIFTLIAALTFSFQLKAQSNYIRLTEHTDIDAYPVFSSKGDKIYFHSTRNSSRKVIGYSSIWMMNNDGSDETEIIKINPPLLAGTISPPVGILDKSDTIFFKEINDIWEIFMIDLSKIKSFPEIRYSTQGSEGNFKKILEVPGGNAGTNVIYNPLTSEVFWAANLSRTGYPYTTYSIRKARLRDLNGQSTMTAGTEIFRTSSRGLILMYDSRPISLSPNFDKLVVAMIIDSNGCNKCQKDLYIIDVNTGNIIRQLTTDGANRVSHEDPCWSPDGQWISFTSNLDGSSSIWIIRPDGSDLTNLTSDTTHDYAASWSPDSKSIVFTSVKDGNHDIYLLEIDNCKNILGDKSSDFENKKIIYNNTANFDSSNKSVMLCPSVSWSGGSIWYDRKLPVQKGFSTEFSFRMSEGVDKLYKETYPGADGIAFVIQNSDNHAMGSLGSGIGYSNIPNSIAIEFDTFKNTGNFLQSGVNDPNENHIAVFCNGEEPNVNDHNSNTNLATIDKIMDMIPDSRIYYSKIEYNIEPNTLKVWLDSVPEITNPPVIVLNDLDLSKTLNLTCDEFAWIGFTSATGLAYEKHEIMSWSKCKNPSSTLIPNPVITSGKDSVCEGHIVTYKSNIEYNIDYEWIVEGGTILNGQNTSEISVKWGKYDTGKIKLIHKYKDTGCSNFYTKEIFIARLPEVQITCTDGFCINNISTLKANINSGITYKWKVTGGEIIGLDNSDSLQVLWHKAGKEKITLIMNFLECQVIDSIEMLIEIHSLPEISFQDSTSFCLNDLPIELKIAVPEGGTYYGNGIISNILFPKNAGVGVHDIFYTYTDSSTKCTNTAKSKFNILPPPEKPTITRTQKKLISSPAFRYQWYGEEGMIDDAVNQEYIPEKSGKFYVITIDENGCKSEMSEPFYFDITDVKNIISIDNDILIFPNPADDEIIIKTVGGEITSILQINDILGRRVNFQIINLDLNNILIKTNNFESGFYFITLKNNSGIHRKIFNILR